MKTLISLALVLVLVLAARPAFAQCNARRACAVRNVVHEKAVIVNEVVAAAAIAVPVVQLNLVAAYGAAYVPPAYGLGEAVGYGQRPATAESLLPAAGVPSASPCDQKLALLLARIDALEKAGSGQAPTPAPTPVVPPVPKPAPVAGLPLLFSRTCIQCHGGASPAKGLALDGSRALACETRLEILRRINLKPGDPASMPPAKARDPKAATDEEAAEVLEWATTRTAANTPKQ